MMLVKIEDGENERSGWRVQPVDATRPFFTGRGLKPKAFRKPLYRCFWLRREVADATGYLFSKQQMLLVAVPLRPFRRMRTERYRRPLPPRPGLGELQHGPEVLDCP